jgi:superfamily II DNA or RNA helicase
MNQWIERIKQFIPTARIGKIQGPTIDVEDKDIVLCMLQSLISKDYPANLFDCFGLTVIDEVHHISSQTFSNALFKLVTKYMLGLSATMERKDGTTRVFKMFLGDVVHKAERKNDGEVEVRALTYKTNDAAFNETILDFKGQPQISSMISKLSTYNRRTEFIIQAITDFVRVDNFDKQTTIQHKRTMDQANPCCAICAKNDNYLVKNTCCDTVKYCLPCLNKVVEEAKNPELVVDKKGNEKSVKRRPKCPSCNKVLAYEQNYIENPHVKPIGQLHTIIMSHNLNVLEYMYNKFVCKNLASVGYYVGGMSEDELKKSETKQVILATFSMCSEGLDIATLNAEFLISPKTDIVQSVGRILRAKHATTNPTIYDIVDSHDVFQRQWLKRKAYYKKQNYRIIGTNSIEYARNDVLDTSTWNMIFDPANGKGKKQVKLCDENDTDSDDGASKGVCLLKFKK